MKYIIYITAKIFESLSLKNDNITKEITLDIININLFKFFFFDSEITISYPIKIIVIKNNNDINSTSKTPY